MDLSNVSEAAESGVPESEIISASLSRSKDLAGTRLLISDENYKHTLAIVRHLGRQGVHVSVAAGSHNALACRSRYCRKVIPASGPDVRALADAMLDAVKRERFDLLMPVSYPLTLAMARRREEFAAYTKILLAEREAIELAANKANMIALASTLGIPAPHTFSAARIEDCSNELTFPAVIKPQKESPGRPPIRYAHNWNELRSILAQVKKERPSWREDDLLVQEFVPGTGCGFFATYQNGLCKRIFMHKRVREYPASGGVSSCAQSFYDPKLENYGRRMLDALDWHGVAMVEFRQDSRDGDYKLMEINPKFWGSLDLALAAGADFPGDLCRMALGETLAFTDTYDRHLRFHWPLSGHGDLFHLWTRPQSIFQVALDCINPRVRSNVWMSDFAPNAVELRALSSRLFRKGKS